MDKSMKHSILVYLIFQVIPVLSMAEEPSLEGRWEAYSSSSQAIYGTILIGEKFVEWGVFKNLDSGSNFPCKARYRLGQNQKAKIFSLELFDKTCALELMKNAQFSENLKLWKIEIVENEQTYINAKFYDIRNDNRESGWGIFTKKNESQDYQVTSEIKKLAKRVVASEVKNIGKQVDSLSKLEAVYFTGNEVVWIYENKVGTTPPSSLHGRFKEFIKQQMCHKGSKQESEIFNKLVENGVSARFQYNEGGEEKLTVKINSCK
ncbi:hypothetical protein [Microbulbifer taiwanensis]|uniref:Uncharacterized protein n=3 Tax=Microbulbifer taiwanensis TaxID=986746 RepID=A0ABW1YQT0_9GAMM|nr:hypothetical protein [Microbulbifer taiwanensis]